MFCRPKFDCVSMTTTCGLHTSSAFQTQQSFPSMSIEQMPMSPRKSPFTHKLVDVLSGNEGLLKDGWIEAGVRMCSIKSLTDAPLDSDRPPETSHASRDFRGEVGTVRIDPISCANIQENLWLKLQYRRQVKQQAVFFKLRKYPKPAVAKPRERLGLNAPWTAILTSCKPSWPWPPPMFACQAKSGAAGQGKNPLRA